MAVDVLCLTEEQKQNLNELIEACRFLLKLYQNKMLRSEDHAAEEVLNFGIDKIAKALKKIDQVAA